MTTPTTDATITGERADLLETLAKHRFFLRFTTRDLTDEQAAQKPTVSALCLGGLIKHVASIEEGWLQFAADGQFPRTMDYQNSFRMLPGETLAGLLERYEQVAARSEAIVAAVPDLSATHPLPPAPWNEPGAVRSIRRVLTHVIAETAQHAGHADILREALDGQTST